MFPVSVSGSVALDAADAAGAQQLLSAFEAALETAGASNVVRNRDGLAFRGRVYVAASWRGTLSSVGSGEITVPPGVPIGLSYRFSTLEMLVMLTGLSIVLAVTGLAAGQPRVAFFMLGAWAVCFVADYLMARWKVLRFIERVMDRSGLQVVRSSG